MWLNINLKKKGNMAREQDRVPDAGPMDLLFDVTIYIYVDIVLER